MTGAEALLLGLLVLAIMIIIALYSSHRTVERQREYVRNQRDEVIDERDRLARDLARNYYMVAKPKATARIALSLLLLVLLAACSGGMYAPNSATVDDVDDQPMGIGTSPSEAVDQVAMPVTAPAACGIWLADTAAQADVDALAGAAPDLVVFTSGHTTCADAIAIAAERWPGRAVVRYVVPWQAVRPVPP